MVYSGYILFYGCYIENEKEFMKLLKKMCQYRSKVACLLLCASKFAKGSGFFGVPKDISKL